MPAIVSLLRAVNVGGTAKLKMDALRVTYERLGLNNVRSYIQSGNVVFQTAETDLPALARRIEDAIEKEYGFRPDVILRTAEEMRGVTARNPFEGREGVVPGKLLVFFLAGMPVAGSKEKLAVIPASVEELVLDGQELFIYFPNGMGQSKLPFTKIDRALGVRGTGRNWNSVLKLLSMAEEL